jgi:hypothetical protein
MYRALSVPRSQTPPKTPHYSAMLHNALISLALAFADDPELCDMRSRQYFARKAKEYIESECQRPSLAVLHALSILGSFHSTQGDQTLGYIYFGELPHFLVAIHYPNKTLQACPDGWRKRVSSFAGISKSSLTVFPPSRPEH